MPLIKRNIVSKVPLLVGAIRYAFQIVLIGFTPLAAQSPAPAPHTVLLKQYCVGCHNEKVKTASISVQALDPANFSKDPATWEKVLRKVRTGQMPPVGMP